MKVNIAGRKYHISVNSITHMNDQIIVFSIRYLPFLIATIAVGFVLLSELRQQIKEIVLMTVVSNGIALTLDKVLNVIFYSPRPFVVANISPLIPHVANNGFPSEHTLLAMMIAGIILVYHKKMGIFLLGLAIAVGLGSVFAKVHHSIDIFGSVGIAATSIFAGLYFMSKIRGKKSTG